VKDVRVCFGGQGKATESGSGTLFFRVLQNSLIFLDYVTSISGKLA
jgi:hypothetical protein